MRINKLLIALFLSGVFMLPLFILSVQSTYAASNINVNTFADELTDNGNCSLREAIQAVNTGSSVDCDVTGGAPYTIILSSGTYTLTIAGGNEDNNATGDLDIITGTVTIQGTGASTPIIRNNVTDRIFDIRGSAVVTISNVIITNGVSPNNDNGGGIRSQNSTLVLTGATVTGNIAERDGGGIFNKDGVLTIVNSTVSSNQARGQGFTGGGVGGGVVNSAEDAAATLTIVQSSIISNSVRGIGGGGISNGARANRTATVTISATIISGNVATFTSVISTAGFGGGIRNSFFADANANSEAVISITNSTIKDNYAYNGGGIGNGTLTNRKTLRVDIENSAISGNTANGENGTEVVGIGGGIINVDGSVSLVNSTVSGNTATGGSGTVRGIGGGIANGGQTAQTTVSLTNTTVSSNTAATDGGGLANANLGLFNQGTANLKNTILGNNTATGGTGPDCRGTVQSQDHNLIESVSGCTISGTTANNITGQNPRLGLLQNNGGNTETHALLTSGPPSPAIDAGDNAACPLTDQRGEARPQGATCDIGAYEATLTGNIFLPIILKATTG